MAKPIFVTANDIKVGDRVYINDEPESVVVTKVKSWDNLRVDIEFIDDNHGEIKGLFGRGEIVGCLDMDEMSANEYQDLALRTLAHHENPDVQLLGITLGMVTEAGECGDIVKKEVLHGHKRDIDKIKKELGDITWYIACVASHYGLSLNDVLEANIDKLRKRFPDGFTTKDSLERRDVK